MRNHQVLQRQWVDMAGAGTGSPTEGEPAHDANHEVNTWLRQTAEGNTRAFQSLYQRTSPRLFPAIRRVLHRREEAEEVLQEVYIAVWQRATQFDARRGSGWAWLLAIARHRAIDRLRSTPPSQHSHHGLTSAHEDDEPADPMDQLPCPSPGPCARLCSRQQAEAVRSGLAALSAGERQSLLLAYHDGLSHHDIALQLGRPVGTVKSWLRRALLRLQARLAPACS